MVPETQKSEFCRLVAEAEAMAAQGNVASGMALLATGALRAEADRDTGEPWAERLIECYQRAMDRYAVSHHLRPTSHRGDDVPPDIKRAAPA